MISDALRVHLESAKGRINVQGLARRSPELMRNLLPPTNMVVISSDCSGAEPGVTGEFSKDRNYIYASFEGIGKAPEYRNGVLYLDDIYLMTASISPVGKQIVREAYSKRWPAGSFADQWLADPEVIKAALKTTRQQHKVLCLSADTMIRVKNRGYVPIFAVTPVDEVWDGENWVTTDGPIYKGEAEVINVMGDYMTPDHEVWTRNGWCKAKDLPSDREELKEVCGGLQGPSGNWAEVWSMVCGIFRRRETWRTCVHIGRRWVRTTVETLSSLIERRLHQTPTDTKK